MQVVAMMAAAVSLVWRPVLAVAANSANVRWRACFCTAYFLEATRPMKKFVHL